MLAFAASASAQTICVAPATGCDVDKTTIPDAVAQSLTNPGADTIRLGAAEYSTAVGLPPGQQADVVGQGASTVIKGSSGILVDNSSGGAVRNLSIKVTGGIGVIALSLAGAADNVSISADPSASAVTGVIQSFAAPGASLTFRHGSITLPLTSGNGAGITQGVTGSPMTVEDSTIQAPQGIVGGAATIRRSTIVAALGLSSSPVTMGPTSQYVEDTVIETQAISGYPMPATGISARGMLAVAMIPSPASVTARHVTIVGDGSAGSTGIGISATA